MIYGFVVDKSMYKRNDDLFQDSSQDQNCGYFSERAYNYYSKPSLFLDPRPNRMTILTKPVSEPMTLNFDEVQITNQSVSKMSDTNLKQFFNIIEYAYLSQNKTSAQLDSYMTANLNNDFTIYTSKSLTVSSGTLLSIYSNGVTTPNITVVNTLSFTINAALDKSNPAVIDSVEVTIYLNQKDFLANYPISTITSVIHCMNPEEYLSLNYASILDALLTSGTYMYSEIQLMMKNAENSSLTTFSTAFVPGGGTPASIEFGILYKGAIPNVVAIKDAIIADLNKRAIATEAQWKIIFPNLWVKGIFLIVPMWNSTYTINPKLIIYKGIQSIQKIMSAMATIYPAFPSGYIANNTEVTRAVCSQMDLAVIFNYTDNPAPTALSSIFPTYQVLSATDQGFKNLSPKAQAFSITLNAALSQALGAVNKLSFSTVVYGGHTYLVFSSNGLDFYILVKKDFPA